MSSREGYHWQSRPWQPSEVQERILEGVARGLTNAEIAAEVGISPDGVKWHVSRALAETGLDDRHSLAIRWQSPRSDIDIRMLALSDAEGSARPAAQPISLDYAASVRAMARSFGAGAVPSFYERVLKVPEATCLAPWSDMPRHSCRGGVSPFFEWQAYSDTRPGGAPPILSF